MKIQAEKSPFFAEKLKIVVLPTLALIKNSEMDYYMVCIELNHDIINKKYTIFGYFLLECFDDFYNGLLLIIGWVQ